MRPNRKPADLRGSLRVWVTLAVVFFILFMVGLGQWDMALAGVIGLVVSGGLLTFLPR